jgi:hypothetical protein
VNIPARVLKDPPDTGRDIRRFILQGFLLGVLWLALWVGLDYLRIL